MTHKIAFSRIPLEQKIPPGSSVWPKFNASFENLELDAMEITNRIYCGYPFTTWHSNHWRNAENYLLGQHIGIDFDTEDEQSSLAHLAKDKFVQKYAHIIYTTPSHTPDKPRARVLFLLDTPIQQSKNYGLAATALLWLFGTGDRQCKDSCRFFYGSIDCAVEYLGNELPLARVIDLIAQYRKTGEQQRRKATKNNYNPNANETEIASALKRIQPWSIDYDHWLKVLIAIYNELGDSGIALAESWAEGIDGEVQRKFSSFRSSAKTDKITVGTLFAIAGGERFP